MTKLAQIAQLDAARAYEALFIPALIGEWAPRVADAVRLSAGERVLDVACGTGILAREAAARVGPSGQVAGVDADAGMIGLARELAPSIDWREGSAEALPFADQSFDVALCQFGLMFFSDRLAALREMLRVLRPGGRVAIAVWDSLDSMPAYADEVELLRREAGPAAAEALRAPFALGDRREMVALASRAGAQAVQIVTQPGTARFPSIRVMVEADLRGWLPVMGVVLAEAAIARILNAADAGLRDHAALDGRTAFRTSVHILTALRA